MTIEPILALLARLRHTAAIAELCLWGHEASHVLPFWLLPFEDGIVADYFSVCLLPCLEPLFWQPAPASRDGVFSIASASGGVEHGLPREESVERSAAEIAAAFGCSPVLGERATPQEFLRHAGETPYLHLAAHGAQDPDAPMFHCLFLNGENGRLFAHQILQCDLRAVRLVTIEACESLLVRYDCDDNLTGLPSLFLRAGAGAVIGALWPVQPAVSAVFFRRLYQSIRRSGTVSGAFRYAQQRTRQEFPQYRDWGTFCMVGHPG